MFFLIKNKYCVKCRMVTHTVDAHNFTSKNNRPMIRGKCAVCGRLKTQFISIKLQQYGGDLISTVNNATSKIKLPWAKFPGEMHLVSHNVTGPGTRLDQRLNPDLTPKEWSMPINHIVNAAYHHDLAYS